MIQFIQQRSRLQLTGWVAVWAALLFIPFLGCVHLFDWDEINFAESAREMIVSGNYTDVQINFQPFYEKPPMFFWLQVVSMKLFGVNEFAARFPNAVVGIITLLVLFRVVSRYFSKEQALLWVLCMTASITPHLYFKSGIIDPLYNLFIFLSTFHLFLLERENDVKRKNILSLCLGIFIGLAVITKGPVVILICFFGYIARVLTNGRNFFLRWADWWRIILLCVVVSMAWFGLYIIKYGFGFIEEFIVYQADLFKNPVADHGQPFWYHPVVLLFGVFPVSALFLSYLFGKKTNEDSNEQRLFTAWMSVQFWVVLILFSMVKTKIVHYSSACFIPMTFLASRELYSLWFKQGKAAVWQMLLNAFVGIILALVFILISRFDLLKSQIIPLIDDDFAVASMNVNGQWQGWEISVGIVLLILVIGYMFWFFRKQYLYAYGFLLIGMSLILPVLLRVYAPHIEMYSQGPAISYIEQCASSGKTVRTEGYKSYAPYFYGKIQSPIHDTADFILKHANDHAASDSNYVKIGERGGFILYQTN